jgi:hypothetical protein
MPGWLKVTLIVIGVIIILVTGLGFGSYLWLLASAQVAEDEGRRFGTDRDSAACVDETVKRTKGIGFFAAVRTRIFFEDCLKAGELTAGFCDGVPDQADLSKSESWETQVTQKYGFNPPFETMVLPHPIQEFCEGQSAPQR